MSACRIARIVRASLPRYARRPFQRRRRGLATAEAQTGGLAAGVRWDLGDLYASPDDPRIETDLGEALELAQRFAERHRGGVARLSAEELARALAELERIGELAARPASYAQLLFSADTSAPRHGALLQRVQERGTEIRNTLVFFELEWVGLDDAVAAPLLAAPALAKRRHFLEAMRRYRPHVLAEGEEKLVEELANTGRRAFSRLFDELVSALRFKLEHAGETRELSEEEVLSLLYAPERELRRAAARSLTEGLRANARPLAFIFNTLVQDKAVDDRLRSFPTALASRHLANEIDAASVDALLSACVARYPLVARYYRLKGRLLGIPQLEDFDRYAPIAEKGGTRSWSDARAVVTAAYRDFSPELAGITNSFFERRWIDAELRAGKRGGAFCASTLPSLHPYVLLNYTGNQRDVMTLAHELGHGVHQSLAAPKGLFEQDTPLTLAETASVFGEMLVFRRMLREEPDPEVRLALVCG